MNPVPPPSAPSSLPKKVPIGPAGPKMKAPASVIALLAAAGGSPAGVKRPVPPLPPRTAHLDDDEDESALLGLAPAMPRTAPPLAKQARVERRRSPSSSSSSSSDSDSSSGSYSDSDSDSSSGSSSSSSSYESSSSAASSVKEETLFDLAKSEGLVSKETLEGLSQEVEAAAPTAPPPRPPVVRSFPSDVDKALDKYHERLNREENMIRIKDDNKAVSLGTSKINYIDPRIVCSWAKAQEVPIGKIFSSTILKKFPWAMNAEGFDF